MSNIPSPRAVATAAASVGCALPVWSWLEQVAHTGLGAAALGLSSTQRHDLDTPLSFLATSAVFLAVAIGVLWRHVRKFQTPTDQVVVRAALELFAVLPASAVSYRVASGAVGSPASVAVAALGGGVIAAWFGLRWWRVPVRLLPSPQPGEIWWADVPFEESWQSKDRPCLVLRAAGRHVTVLMFTSQGKVGQSTYHPVPPQVWRSPKRSFLRLDRRIRLDLEVFRRIETTADPSTLAAAGLR